MNSYNASPVIGMNYMDTVSNGSTRRFSSRLSNHKHAIVMPSPSTPINMNWLIYTFFSRQEFALCAAIIEKQLQKHVHKAYAFFIKGLIARQRGDLTESLQCLQQAINAEPTNANNYKEIGRTLLALGRLRHALDAFRHAETLATRPDAEIFYHIGDLLLRKGEPNSDEQPHETAANRKASIAKDATIVGTALPALNADVVEAKQYFMKSIQNDNRQVLSFRKLSAIFVRERDYPRAIEMLESVVQTLPENVEILTEVGCLYLLVNNTKSAFDRLHEAMKLNERYTRALLALGAIYQSKNDMDGALNKYKLINVSTEDSCELWSNIGLCFLKKRKFVAAIACLKKSVWMSPLNFNCVFNLAVALLTAQQYASAYYAFSVAANIRPNHAETLMFIGICLRNLRDLTNAAMAFERASLLPEALVNPVIYLNFAVFCYEIEQPKAAHEAIANVTQMTEQMPMRKEYMKVLLTLQERLASEYPAELAAAAADSNVEDTTTNPSLTTEEATIEDDQHTDNADGDLV